MKRLYVRNHYKGSLIAKQIIDDNRDEARRKARALKMRKLYQEYKKKRGESNGK